MSVCFTSFKRDGFWCRDDGVLVWFAVLAKALQAAAVEEGWARQDWAQALATLWRELAELQFDEVSLSLSDYLETDGRRLAILRLGQQQREAFATRGRGCLGAEVPRVARKLWERDPVGAERRVMRAADSFLWLLDEARPELPAHLAQLFEGPT